MHMKIDTHTHSMGISLCSRISYERLIDSKKSLGYDGAILTNHCQSHYYAPEMQDQWLECFIKEYNSAAEYAAKRNFKLFFGMEVTLSSPKFADYLLFGLTESVLRSVKCCMYNMTQKQLFSFCEDNGMLLIQAHPLRHSDCPSDPAFLHGLEINCQPNDLIFAEKIVKFAEDAGLFVTCGTDYHHDSMTFRGGMIFDDKAETSPDLAAEMRKRRETTLFLEDKTLRIPHR